MERKSEAETKALEAKAKGHAEASRISDETFKRAYQAYNDSKKQIDSVYEQAKKIAVDKQAKEVADKAHKEALDQAKKLRDAIVTESNSVFRISYDKAEADYLESQTKSQVAIKEAEETYKEAKKQAEIVYKDAKKLAVDKQAKKEADEAYKKATEQAKQVRDEAMRKFR